MPNVKEKSLNDKSFDLLFQQSSDAILIVSRERFSVLKANPSFCVRFGYSAEEILSKTLDSLFPDDRGLNKRPDVIPRFQKAGRDTDSGKPACTNRNVLDSRGIIHRVCISESEIIYDNTHAIMMVFCVAENSNENPEVQFVSDDEMIISAFKNVEDIAVMILEHRDGEFVICKFNRGVKKIFNYSQKEMQELRFNQICDSNLISKMEFLFQLKTNENKNLSGEFIFVKKGNEKFLSHTVVNTIHGLKSKEQKIFLVISDISDLKKNEKEFILARNQLEEKIWMRTLALNDINQSLKQEVLSRRKSELLISERRKVLEMLIGDAPLDRILDAIAQTSQIYNKNLICAIMLYDLDAGKLEYGFKPEQIPPNFMKLLSGKSVLGGKEPCAQCAAFARRIVIEDIQSEVESEEYKKAAKNAGITASVQEPIVSRDGVVIGIFSIYYREKRHVSASDIDFANHSAYLAGIAIERRKQITELFDSEERWRTLVESSPDLILTLDLDFKITFVNHEGLSLEENVLLGKNIRDIFKEEDSAKVLRHITDVLHENKNISVMMDLALFPNEKRSLSMRMSPLRKNKKNIGVMILINDVTEQKRAKDAIQISEEKFKAIFNNASIGFITADKNGKIKMVNEVCCEMFGYTRKEMLGMTFKNLLSESDANIISALLGKIWIGDYSSLKIEKQFITKNKKTIWVNFSLVLVKQKNGSPDYILAHLEDISEKKDAEKQRELLEGKIYHSQKLETVGKLAGGIAHDFNNILTPIILTTELVQLEYKKDPRIKELIKNITDAAIRGKDLIKQILTFSKMDEQRSSAVKFSEILGEVIRFIRPTFPSSIFISQDIQSNEYVFGDPTRIHQVIMNLCTNAYNAMENTGGKLFVGLYEVQRSEIKNAHDLSYDENIKYLKFIIQDTGVGIPPSVIGKIFDPFFTTREMGSGLGLSVVHGIVSNMKGEIIVESNPGQGTIFTIYLPIHSRLLTGEGQDNVIANNSLRASEKRPKILLVDDEIPIIKLLKLLLNNYGYDVTTFNDPLDALDHFIKEGDLYDLMITDMTMPGMTGDNLAREVISIRPDLPVILCTGYNKNMSDETLKNIGIKDILIKPILKEELMIKIEALLRKNSRK